MNIRVADTLVKKMVGLLGTKTFPDCDGLFFPDVACIHTFFMKYPIDIVFLDKDNKVNKILGHVKPFRIVWGSWKSVSVLELADGSASARNIKVGDIIGIEGKENG
ncbi:MAG: DUF192 domain-containing protein [Candidatus Aureabacteria bacterium]|nr:DUF192 domain-containing protein [Candidatus Auribacterota bacterium]